MSLLIASLLGFLVAPVAALAGRWPARGGLLLALLPAGLAVFFLLQIDRVADGAFVEETTRWVPSMSVDLVFLLDGFSLLFALLVSGIGAVVLVYSGAYLHGTAAVRFFPILLAFMASMLGLVLSGNLLILYLFWALTSLTSFLLIGFDFRDPRARTAATQALLVTVSGELAMLGGLVLLADAAGSYTISEVLVAGDAVAGDPRFGAILVLLLVGAMSKSAQAPFHFWLPNAMAAPTPVSAYLHSATMVQAGVFLLARLHPVLAPAALWTPLVGSVGAVTMVVGGFLALRARDLKRVLAYSTVAALGVLVLLLGVGTHEALVAAMAFLVAHALYKAALFLVVGIVDHETGARTVDALGGLARRMPATALTAGLAALSMAGLPPFLGFISKELLYETTLHDTTVLGPVFLVVAVVTSVAFVAVAGIVGLRPFTGAPTAAALKAHGEPLLLWSPPLVLAGLGLLLGLAPGLVGPTLLVPAATAVAGVAVTAKLDLWHGLTPALALSVVTIGAGVAVFAVREPVHRILGHVDLGRRFGPQHVYVRSLSWVVTVALVSSRFLQNGNLRHYLLTTLWTAVALVALALVRTGGVEWFAIPVEARLHEVTAAGLVVLAALVAVLSGSRLAAIAALGVVGYGVALLYLLFGAPDLALTQILIETLTMVLFILVFYHLPGFLTISAPAVRIRDAAISIAAGTVMALLVLAVLPDEGQQPISLFFVEAAKPLAHARNVVNAILVDFRALDTLGEITVLALAGLGVLALLRLTPMEKR